MSTSAAGLAAQKAGAGGVGLIVLLVCVAGLIAIVVAAFSPRWRRPVLRGVGAAVGGVLGLYLIGRGIAEFFVVNYSNPASYRNDWGGPSLVGVFAVHTGPGVLVLIGLGIWLYRRRRSRTAPAPTVPSATVRRP